MGWGKLSDDLPEHPKFYGIYEKLVEKNPKTAATEWQAVLGLWLIGMCTGNRNGCDGVLSRVRWMAACGSSQALFDRRVNLLLAAGLLHEEGPTHLRFHDWADYNLPKRQRNDKSARDRARVRRWREEQKRNGVRGALQEGVDDQGGNAAGNADPGPGPGPGPGPDSESAVRGARAREEPKRSTVEIQYGPAKVELLNRWNAAGQVLAKELGTRWPSVGDGAAILAGINQQMSNWSLAVLESTFENALAEARSQGSVKWLAGMWTQPRVFEKARTWETGQTRQQTGQTRRSASIAEARRIAQRGKK